MTHKIGIIGGSGYTGVELLRILLNRSDVTVTFISSRTHQGTRVDGLFPSLRGACDLEFTDPAVIDDSDCDLVFFATPNGTAMKQAPSLLEKGVKVVDLSADFRLKDVATFEKWYGMSHSSTQWLEKAVYGLTEINRGDIAKAQLVANPGCYPTATQLGFIPLLEQDWVDTGSLVADAKSGVTGAGRGAQVPMLLAEAGDNFKAYAANGHRHLPEIEQGLNEVCGGGANLTFTPHLLPMIRGIHATLYARLKDASLPIETIQQHFEQRYANEPFVDVLPQGSHPETRSVRGSNTCRIAVLKPQNRDTVVVLAVEDNLVKGVLGLSETAGLGNIALSP